MSRRGRKKKKSHIDESWLLPYSDLLTLLVALFIVLFAMSDINVQKYEQLASVFRSEFSSSGSGVLDHQKMPAPSPAEEEEDESDDTEENTANESEELNASEMELRDLQALQAQVNNYIRDHELTEQLGTELTDEGLMITLVNEVFFDSGSAEMKDSGREIAGDVSNLLYTDPPHQVVISGHADDVPIETAEYQSNWELSVSRAVNFMTLILENEELDPTAFSAKGYGEYQPIVPNTSDENRTKNRRVEVLILPNYDINVPE